MAAQQHVLGHDWQLRRPTFADQGGQRHTHSLRQHQLYLGGTTVLDGTLILTNQNSLGSGTSLTVGDEAWLLAGVVPSVITESPAISPSPVPEPGTLALLAVTVCSAAVCHRVQLRRGHRRVAPTLRAANQF